MGITYANGATTVSQISRLLGYGWRIRNTSLRLCSVREKFRYIKYSNSQSSRIVRVRAEGRVTYTNSADNEKRISR